MHFQKLQDIVKENQGDPWVYASTYVNNTVMDFPLRTVTK